MIIINNIKLSVNAPSEEAIEKAKGILALSQGDIASIWVHKVSVDARKGDVKFVYSVAAKLNDEKSEINFAGKNKDIVVKEETDLTFARGEEVMPLPPVICGFGPAGLMCALVLAKMGFAPLVIEQGMDIDSRTKAVREFENGGVLNTKSNIQFGEGGAGTFSDGKLTTRIGDERCDFITKTFIRHGAPAQIAQSAKPHIGTDLLVDVIKSIRTEIISLGGKIMFNTTLEDIKMKNGKICGVKTDKGEIATEHLIMATGHSARQIFSMLKDSGALIEAKPFSVGVRIEHLQSDIEKSLYHGLAGNPILPKGEYQLSETVKGRGIYTFCMCPGGKVVAAASEENSVVVNGMSNHARDGLNANSALVVSVTPEDFDNDFTKAIEFQRRIEKAAYNQYEKSYKAPCQTLDNFFLGKKGMNIKTVEPTYPLGVKEGDFAKIFPPFVTEGFKAALPAMNRKITGFSKGDSLLTGVETRTSSPARILRTEDLQSNIKGLYPCGEGAGYAGGIMSAAVDGVKIAQYITAKYRPKKL
ncbi:MAG: hypothetical protein RR198_00505 [Oscillospiraceae bacterium]